MNEEKVLGFSNENQFDTGFQEESFDSYREKLKTFLKIQKELRDILDPKRKELHDKCKALWNAFDNDNKDDLEALAVHEYHLEALAVHLKEKIVATYAETHEKQIVKGLLSVRIDRSVSILPEYDDVSVMGYIKSDFGFLLTYDQSALYKLAKNLSETQLTELLPFIKITEKVTPIISSKFYSPTDLEDGLDKNKSVDKGTFNQ